jgi:hypothetical protein
MQGQRLGCFAKALLRNPKAEPDCQDVTSAARHRFIDLVDSCRVFDAEPGALK